MAHRCALVPRESLEIRPAAGDYRWIELSELDANEIAEGAIFLQDA